MQIFDFSVAVGKTSDIYAEGRYIYYYSGLAGSSDATITLREDTTGTNIVLSPGQAFRIPPEQKTATRWIIGNYGGGSTITGRLVIGSGSFDDNRVSGSINVINEKKNRSLANSSFIGSVIYGAYINDYPGCAIWNPSNGINVFISKITISSPTAQLIKLGTFTSLNGFSQQMNLYSKRMGLSSSTSSMQLGPQLGIIPDGYTLLGSNHIPANNPVSYHFDDPIILGNGKGFMVTGVTKNTELSMILEAYEENV